MQNSPAQVLCKETQSPSENRVLVVGGHDLMKVASGGRSSQSEVLEIVVVLDLVVVEIVVLKPGGGVLGVVTTAAAPASTVQLQSHNATDRQPALRNIYTAHSTCLICPLRLTSLFLEPKADKIFCAYPRRGITHHSPQARLDRGRSRAEA